METDSTLLSLQNSFASSSKVFGVLFKLRMKRMIVPMRRTRMTMIITMFPKRDLFF